MFNSNDKKILRNLAQRVKEIAENPINEKKRDLWIRHNMLQTDEPVIMIDPEGSWRELLPPENYECTHPFAREVEEELRQRIYTFEYLNDDTPIEPTFFVKKQIVDSGYGLEVEVHDSSEEHGAYSFEQKIKSLEDLKQLQMPKISWDKKESLLRLDFLTESFGDILNISLQGIKHISYHLMYEYIHLRGFESMFLDMYDVPELFHGLTGFFTKAHQSRLEQYQSSGLLELNNDDTYQSSGGLGYTNEIPKQGINNGKACPANMWASAESQEMSAVSPDMHRDFVMTYEKKLLAPFGLTGYGCCEDLTQKLDSVFQIPGIRRISVSPWADVLECAHKIRDQYILSWKPNPAHLAGGFDAPMVEDYLKKAVKDARNCSLEIILKDTHTCNNKAERFTQWSALARKAVNERNS